MKDSFEEVFKEVQTVLVVTAHPDDAEVIAGGTISRLVSKGKEVNLVVMTNGGKGNKLDSSIKEVELAKRRTLEVFEAGAHMGLKKKDVKVLNFPDGEIESTFENIGRIVFEVRRTKPDIVITHNFDDYLIQTPSGSSWVNHRDHRNTGRLTLDAVYPYSRDANFFPEHKIELGKDYTHQVFKILIPEKFTDDNLVYFDIEKFLKQKKAAMQSHKNAFSEEDVEMIMEEAAFDEGYCEIFKYFEVY